MYQTAIHQQRLRMFSKVIFPLFIVLLFFQLPSTNSLHAEPEGCWPTHSTTFNNSGSNVTAIQYLVLNRDTSVSVDGFYGSGTQNAVAQVQANNGLAADGIVGPSTWQNALIFTLRQGDTAQSVRALQHLLLHKFGYNVTVDAIFGPATHNAVVNFQSSRGLAADGVVGSNTWAELVCINSPPPTPIPPTPIPPTPIPPTPIPPTPIPPTPVPPTPIPPTPVPPTPIPPTPIPPTPIPPTPIPPTPIPPTPIPPTPIPPTPIPPTPIPPTPVPPTPIPPTPIPPTLIPPKPVPPTSVPPTDAPIPATDTPIPPTDMPQDTPTDTPLPPPADPVAALSAECRDITPPGNERSDICIVGFVYMDGEPTNDVTVSISVDGATASKTQTAAHVFPQHEMRPYYRADLSQVAETIAADDLIAISAEVDGQKVSIQIVARAGLQQVDLVIPSDDADADPISTINYVGQRTLQEDEFLTMVGGGQVGDASGEIVAWRWELNNDLVLGESPDLDVPADTLPSGIHKISLRVRDDAGNWSPPVTTEISVIGTDAEYWTVLLYLAGDFGDGGALHRKFEKALNRIRRQLKNPNVRIAAIVDGPEDDDTMRYLIEPGKNRQNATISEPLPVSPNDEGKTERAMDDPATITEFINWGTGNFPTDFTYLVIANHGQALRGIAWDRTSDIADGGEELSAHLTTKEIAQAIKDSRIEQVDILHFDACSMNLFEVAYELRDQADYLLSSQYYGWDYFAYEHYAEQFDLLSTPDLIARRVIREYAHLAESETLAYTISVLDLSQVASAHESLDALSGRLIELLDADDTALKSTLRAVRTLSQKFDSDNDLINENEDVYIDLLDWAVRLERELEDEQASRLVSELIDSLTGSTPLIIGNEVSTAGENPFLPPEDSVIDLGNGQGISIYYPLKPSQRYEEYFEDTLFSFTEQSQWPTFLGNLSNLTSPDLEPLPGPHELLSQEEIDVFLPLIIKHNPNVEDS